MVWQTQHSSCIFILYARTILFPAGCHHNSHIASDLIYMLYGSSMPYEKKPSKSFYKPPTSWHHFQTLQQPRIPRHEDLDRRRSRRAFSRLR
jgi:hypothetical protein